MEGKKEQLSKSVRELEMQVRPFMDELIVEHTVNYIQNSASAGKPFFLYVGLSHLHPPEKAHPDFDQKSPERLG